MERESETGERSAKVSDGRCVVLDPATCACLERASAPVCPYCPALPCPARLHTPPAASLLVLVALVSAGSSPRPPPAVARRHGPQVRSRRRLQDVRSPLPASLSRRARRTAASPASARAAHRTLPAAAQTRADPRARSHSMDVIGEGAYGVVRCAHPHSLHSLATFS